MALDSRIPLNTAIYNALVASVALQALIGNPVRVYALGGVPQSLWPGDNNDFAAYCVIGQSDGKQGQADTKTEDGMEGDTEVHTWSTARSVLESQQIQAVLVDEIKVGNLSLASGHNLVLIYPSFVDTFQDESWDAPVIHGINRFRYMTERG